MFSVYLHRINWACRSTWSWRIWKTPKGLKAGEKFQRSTFFRVVLLNIPFNAFILLTYVSTGLIVYQYYASCHPQLGSTNEVIQLRDELRRRIFQLLPKFVLDALSHMPGIVGLFAAAIYSAGIRQKTCKMLTRMKIFSTLSSSFAALSALLISDVTTSFNKGKIMRFDEKRAVTVARFLRNYNCAL